MSEPARIIAFGDIHGCAHALDTLLDAIQPASEDLLIFLGDLVDKGRDSAAVLERLIRLSSECHVVLIQGNHEELMFGALQNEPTLRYWENCGGVATLNSYRFGAHLSDIPETHWELLRSCRPYFETESFIFTHANYQPDLAIEDQLPHDLRWAFLEPDLAKPHYTGKTFVVGHSEQKNSEILDLGFLICLDTACWKYGWLTALDVNSRQYWQASRWGVLRENEEPTHRGQLPQFARLV